MDASAKEDRAHAESWAPDGAGALYERGRPGYPEGVSTVLRDVLGVDGTTRIADVAAGTGKLTRLLADLGAGQVLAVEPMPGMLAQLRATCPDVPALRASAEQLPLATGSLDAITVAQAFHWLRVPEAAAEFRRTLRPGGRLIVVSNRPSHEHPWQEELWATLRRYEELRPRPASVRTWRDALAATGLFTRFDRYELAHEQRFASLDELDARMGSISHVLLLDPADRREMLARMHEIVGRSRPIFISLRTTIEVATPTR